MSPSTAARFGQISTAVERSGVRRAKLYQLAAQENRGLFKKHGNTTLVDLEKLDAILAELPDAEIGRGER